MVRTPYTSLSGTWSQSNSWHQVSGGMSGMLVGHAGGITFSPERSDTVALVHAPDAYGAHLDGVPGTRFDKNGYAILPWLRPWRVNDVTIDETTSPEVFVSLETGKCTIVLKNQEATCR